MTKRLRFVRSILATVFNCYGLSKGVIPALLFVLPGLGAYVSAQNTTISGTVYDPRTTASALPLSNVLVYVTTGTVAPLPAGMQCLTASTPSGVVSYTNTAVDGTFTLTGVPENATYTLVIQAGKWRRQFSETVAATPLTGLALHMPADHTQGDIPFIAIATGSVDGLECVFHDMGIADTEFTDDNGTTNVGGRIHLYQGSGSPGAYINASTPSQTVLMGTPTNSSLMNSYDMVMLPCQGSPNGQSTPTAETNLLNYANAGGRVFTTHYSYVWLDPGSPYDSQFPPVADWNHALAYPVPDPGPATINTGFNDGANLSQWLQNAGVSYNNTPGQVILSTLRRDFTDVVPPTQSWATMNSDGAIMQMTFNTPVGAPAANQCGRVLYNEYHVINPISVFGRAYPSECPTIVTMSPQEEMLEYALFDLSTFVTPVVVPTLNISFTPSPLIVKQGDNADQVTVNVTNTSTNEPIVSSVVLTFVLPTGLTVTAMTDSTGGWNCTVSTLTCTRTTVIAASASDPVTLTMSVAPYPPGGLASYTGLLSVTASSSSFSTNVTASDTVIFQQLPAITWATPAPIIYGTALSGTQLNASSPVAGSFSYSPSAGTVLGVGQHTLQANFTPTDTTDYTGATATVVLTVIPASPALMLTAAPNPGFLSNPVTFTVAISSFATMPTGTVIFYDGSTQLGSAGVAAGSATFTTSALTAGNHSISAAYSGDASYGAATSGALSETIQDFTLALSGGIGATGTSTTYPLLITPLDGATLPAAVSLSVAGVPSGMTVVFTPATVTANSGATNVMLQVTSPDKVAVHPSRKPLGGNSLPVALGLILLPFASKLRKGGRRCQGLLILAAIGAALAIGLNGCGGVTLTPQTSTLTISATSGSLSHSIVEKLTVQ